MILPRAQGQEEDEAGGHGNGWHGTSGLISTSVTMAQGSQVTRVSLISPFLDLILLWRSKLPLQAGFFCEFVQKLDGEGLVDNTPSTLHFVWQYKQVINKKSFQTCRSL